jgi:hypothetical protein
MKKFSDPGSRTKNPGKFTLGSGLQLRTLAKFIPCMYFSSLLGFSILFTLKLDRVLDWSWWAVFVPLWLWKGIASRRVF